MSENPSTDAEINKSVVEATDDEIIEINFENLSIEQKKSIILVGLVLILEALILTNVRLITGLFKGLIRDPHKIITDYVANFIDTLVPYIFVFLVFLLLYQIYLILLNNLEDIKDLSEAFYIMLYVITGNFGIIIVFASINPAIPTYTEMFIFIFVFILLITVFFLPSSYLYGKIPENVTNEELLDN